MLAVQDLTLLPGTKDRTKPIKFSSDLHMHIMVHAFSPPPPHKQYIFQKQIKSLPMPCALTLLTAKGMGEGV